MSKPRYLYIDDENEKTEQSILNGFNDPGIIDAIRFPLGDFKEFGLLKGELLRLCASNEFDGIIIDLRLDGEGQDRTLFNATAITSELRSVAARKEIKSFPIVVCSSYDKMLKTYDADRTSHDLFDYKIYKANTYRDWIKTCNKLKSLAEGYNQIQSQKVNLENILGIANITSLDNRIIDLLYGLEDVPYNYAYFVLKELFHQTNPLINERILAARLGVDLVNTPQKVWEELSISVLNGIRYTGLFAEGWKRWWAEGLVEWFNNISGEKLAFLNAEKRVEILKKITGLDELVAANPLEFCTSSEFWTICEGYKVPIDPLEAFKVHTTADLKPWQESKMISLLAILEREGFVDRGLKPHLSELERIEFTKEQLGIK